MAEAALPTMPGRESPDEAPDGILLIANRNASGVSRGNALAGAVRALRSYGGPVAARTTSTPEELAELLAGAGGRVALLGGDGSVHTVANVPGTLPELALLPAGRANNIARSLGIPLDLDAAAALAVRGRARPLDVIEARADGACYRAVEGISVGFHAQARVNYRADNSAALAHGLAVGISALRKFRPIEVVISRNGEQKEERIAQLFAANLPFYGFGLHVAPGAEPDDGQLELVTMEAQTRRALLRMIPHLRRGTHVGRRGVSVARASRVRIDPRGSSPVVADSTDLGSGPVELTVLPQALQVVTP